MVFSLCLCRVVSLRQCRRCSGTAEQTFAGIGSGHCISKREAWSEKGKAETPQFSRVLSLRTLHFVIITSQSTDKKTITRRRW